jgi:hypothetical protein
VTDVQSQRQWLVAEVASVRRLLAMPADAHVKAPVEDGQDNGATER